MKFFKKIIITGFTATFLVLFLIVLLIPAKHKDSTNLSPNVTYKTIELDYGTTYTSLREVDIFGNHFLMLRHNPTGQRLIMLIVNPEQKAFCQSMFEEKLSSFHFSLLIPVFKQNSSFKNRSVVVKNVAMDKEGILSKKPYQLAYKRYLVSASVDGKMEQFEAYVGKLLENSDEKGLIFTFNSLNYASLQPFWDILKVAGEKQAEKTRKAD